MKKINSKGFTLIELLAVIVIMAIILIITVPNIIQSINDAKINSLHNLAVNVANTYDMLYAQDMLASDENKVLGWYSEIIDEGWTCIGDLDSSVHGGFTDKKLSEILGLNGKDIVLTERGLFDEANQMTDGILNSNSVRQNTCSAIRIRNSGVEVVLVAAEGGKFYVEKSITYAYSEDTSAKKSYVRK